MDFEALKEFFDKSRKHIEIDKLRGKINAQLQAMLQLNKSRVDFAASFEGLIADYNKGGKDVDTFFVELISFARTLSEEEQRGVSENLSDEELALFDLLTRPNIKLNPKEREQVKQVAKELLDTLKAERIVLDWRKQQKTRALFAWLSLTHSNNSLNHTQQIYIIRNANWFINMCMRSMQG